MQTLIWFLNSGVTSLLCVCVCVWQRDYSVISLLLKLFPFCFYYSWWSHSASTILGCCSGICFNEANTLCTSFGEALSYWHEIWICEAVLYWDSGRQCNIQHSPRGHDKLKPPRTGLSGKRRWSLAVLFKASSTTQVIGRDLKDPLNLKISLVGRWCPQVSSC